MNLRIYYTAKETKETKETKEKRGLEEYLSISKAIETACLSGVKTYS